MYRRNLRDYPAGGPHGGLTAVYRAEGRTRDALDEMRTERERKGDSAGAARIPVASSDTQARPGCSRTWRASGSGHSPWPPAMVRRWSPAIGCPPTPG